MFVYLSRIEGSPPKRNAVGSTPITNATSVISNQKWLIFYFKFQLLKNNLLAMLDWILFRSVAMATDFLTKHTQNTYIYQCFVLKWLKIKDFITYITKIT